MKQYLLLLRSGDFKKYYPQNNVPTYANNVSSELISNFRPIGVGRSSDSEILDLFTQTSANNIWVSDSFNLYANEQFSNFSYFRSRYGLNLVGDRTYVGTEIASPSYSEDSTPYSENAIYQTEIGEIVRDNATPSLLRFIDTSSRIDILSFKYSFTNLIGTVTPTIAVTVLESDSKDGPWLKSSISGDTGIIFIRNAKPFIKLVVEVSGEEIDYSTIGILFYLEVGIHDPSQKVLSDSARNILKRFPSWTALFEDSVADATPSLAVPESTGGKFINSLVQESLDNFSADVDIHDINAFITSADENMLAWIYISYNVPANINLIYGDSVPLARVSTLKDLLDGFETDYSFFYNPIEKQLISLRKYNSLIINSIVYEQEPINIFNDFDEFGARVGLPRLYLENNLNYKKRILDVNQNLPGVTLEAFKRTIRREMDLWRAYGSTPDSNFVGATPEVLEISDMENDPLYFSVDGSPLPKFRSLVSELNTRYPSNIGYIRWGDSYWDYAGLKGEGVNRIPAIYDVATPLGNYFQPGVGDFNDGLITFRPLDSSTISFSGAIDIAGFKAVSETDIYTPIRLDYDAYFTYTKTVSDSLANNVGAGFVYEVYLPPHGEYASPTAFYSNINYTSDPNLYVTNYFMSTSSASPEFKLINIFDQDGFSDPEIEFRHKVYGDLYENGSNNDNTLNIYDAASVNLVMHRVWNHNTQSYSDLTVGNYKTKFNYNAAPVISDATPGTVISLATPNLNNVAPNVRIGSNLYNTKPEFYSSQTYSNTININSINDMSITGATPGKIFLSNIKNSDILPHDATPGNIYINPRNLEDYTLFGEEFYTQAIGGISYNPYDDTEYLVPASPNITYTKYLVNGTQVDSVEFFESATVNYSSSINYVEISSSDGQYYPLTKTNYEYFSATSTPNLILGFMDENGNVYKDENEYNNTYTIGDRYLDSISLNKDTFNLDHSSKYIVDYLSFSATPSTVDVYVENSETLISNFNSAIVNNSSIVEAVYAVNDEVRTDQFGLGIHTGYIYFDNSDQYIYSNPITENYNGQFFEILLSKVPRKAAPIIVKVGDEEYRNIVFEDSATPGKPSFWNTESVFGSYDESLYLSYENVKNIDVIDTFSGQNISTGKSVTGNVFKPFSNYFTSVNGGSFTVAHNQALNLSSGLDYDIIFRMRLSEEMLDIAETYYLLFFTGLYTSSGYRIYLVRNGSDFKLSMLTHNSVPVGESGGTGTNVTSNYLPNTFNNTRWFRISRSSSSSDFNEYSGNSLKFYYAEDSEDIPSSWIDLGYDAYYSADYSSYSATPDVVNDKAYWLWDTPNVASNSDLDFFQLDDEPYTSESIPTADMYVFKIWNGDYQSSEPILDIDFTKQANGILSFNEASSNQALVSVSGDIAALGNKPNQIVSDREYEVTYYVNNAFYVDKDVYNSSNDEYEARLYLSSTPSSATPYFITYESSQYDDHMNIDLSMNQIDVPIDEGFIYISKENFEFGYVELYLSPNYISDSSEDLLYLSIISYDVNGNVKPYQTFEINCSELTVNNLISSFDSGSLNYITTNQYGYARAILKYSGSVPAELKNSSITLNGVLSGESYSHPNSQTDDYSKEIEFEILRSIEFKLELKATTSKLVVDADGVTKIGITGKILWNNKPFKHSLELGWAKARTLYSLFESTGLTSFYSDGEGNFVLDEIIAQDNSDPDQWFARIETLTLVSEINQMLIDDGEVIPPFGITIVGDIVYWNERYDNIHYSNEPIPMLSPGSLIKEDNSDIIATPRFVYSHFNSSNIINTNSTPNWIPPQWVPLRRIDQYQIGLLGSTPNIISVYDNIHPDSGEE